MQAADTSFGLNHQALAVLHLVAGLELEIPGPEQGYFHTSTAPWYNGRERGVLFSIQRMGLDVKTLYIAVFEHRNGDGICALKWSEAFRMNPPTIDTSGKLAYPTDNKYDDIVFQTRYGECGKMAMWVLEQMQEYIDTNKKGEK